MCTPISRFILIENLAMPSLIVIITGHTLCHVNEVNSITKPEQRIFFKKISNIQKGQQIAYILLILFLERALTPRRILRM